MAIIGYDCSHERFKPSELLRYPQLAEEVGFKGGMCSEHFHPWSEQQGQSGFAWAWLGAALQRTGLSFGMVTSPGQCYNPAITAQAIATLAEMFPGRVWCALGSGQFLNEHITGEAWPTRAERQARLQEAVEVIRALWAGETVTHRGRFVVEEARLYTLPETSPLILGAAITDETARWVGSWADGVMTVAKSYEDQRKFIESFRSGGGQGKPMYLQSLLSYDPQEQAAVQGAWESWRPVVFGSEAQADLKMPSHFDAVAQYVRPEDMYAAVRI